MHNSKTSMLSQSRNRRPGYRPDRSRRVFALLLALLLPLPGAGCTARPDTGLRIGTNIWAGYEPLYLARSLGWFEHTGIRLIEFPSSKETMSALRSGGIEAGALTLDEVLTLTEQGVDLHVVLLLDVSDGADAVLVQPGLMPNELRGKRIGAEASAVGGYMLERMLDSFGIPLDEITILPMGVDEHEEAFARQEIDAVVTFEPVKSRLVKLGGQVIFDSSQIPGEIIDVLAIRTDALKGRSRSLALLSGRWFDALNYMQNNPAESTRLMQPRLKLPSEDIGTIFQGLRMGARARNRSFFDSALDTSINKADRLMRLMRQNGMLKRDIDVRQLFAPGMPPAMAKGT